MKPKSNNRSLFYLNTTILQVAMISLLSFGNAFAVPLGLVDATRCGAGSSTHGIAASDVTGNMGGASECWGTFGGNDPGPSGDGFEINGMQFDFIAKENTPGAVEGLVDIGLNVSMGATGTWAFDSGLFNPDAFLIVLKAANNPGYAVWLFEGTAAGSSSGTWAVAWSAGQSQNSADLSHLSIYAKNASDVPEPSILALFGLGLVGLGVSRRRR